ncbi:MAG: ATP-dependent DNA helicase RecG [Ruminococcaceae bacterium]|nr:ATP-dependent DNA helicase RecG [Oscillospiraceae bacterium]
MELGLNTPVSDFPGIGPARAQKLAKLGIATAGDLLHYFPRNYEDRRSRSSIIRAPEGEPVCIQAMVAETPRLSRVRRGLDLVKVKAVDHSGMLHITYFNQAYLKDALRSGEEYIFFGKIEVNGRSKQMTNPVTEPVGKNTVTGCILPVYPLTAGISNNLMASLTRRAVDGCAHLVEEALPKTVLRDYELAQSDFSYKNIHFPEHFELLDLARRRLIFEELFYLAAGLALLKGRRSGARGPVCRCESLTSFLDLLPFSPTAAQLRVMDECREDMAGGRPMNRLVQGDVGSGKTAVAAAAAWVAIQNGLQTALMAPTEILARQHANSLRQLLSPAGIRVGLLVGSMTQAQKKDVRQQLKAGDLQLVVGTHALLSGSVEFGHLGLVIADEQHRFGVSQRAALTAKGERPHVLVMSATPIPRTLALIVYGDLDVSVIDELPPGRIPVETFVIGEDKRQRMYGFVRKLAHEGRQVYMVCPAVEDNPDSWEGLPDLKSVTSYAEELRRQVFPDLRVGFVHGKLKTKEKEAVMGAFSAGELDVLVSTTVIEVGVDVPNAALMIVENAERFGLSQLHQLRGRVGRGKHQSYCVLVSSSRSEVSRTRLKAMTDTTDGFKIAEEDLKLRGPGDFFGNRQHGLPQLRIADLAGDMRLLSQAQEAARAVLTRDPNLSLPEHQAVRERIHTLFAEQADIFN